ncbi:hypothetical protein D9758_006415 [Tetrapyrgos nigripes]|uniref:F-box domain-containing protein n=1 Tax=Tetrapyrgos nigripes TaxID=182062 RepID=A0A8H5G0F3_9AGAR|nr:hypothetical protein D9758_006415 [Tetrapyrgos nigripes]
MQSLPTELLQKIGDETERLADRKSLRRTCRRLGHVFKSTVLREVTLNIYKHHTHQGLSLLHALVDQKDSGYYSSVIQVLHIVSLSPSSYSSQDGSENGIVIPTEHHPNDVEPECTSGLFSQSIQGLMARVDIMWLLGSAIQSLQNLKAIRWHWRLSDGEWAFKTIISSLSSLQSIKEFTFRYTIPKTLKHEIVIPQIDLPNLETLSISVSSYIEDSTPHPVMSNLANHLASQANSLSTLHLENETSYGKPLLTLSNLDVLANETFSDLSRLDLIGWSLPDNFISIFSKFTNLTSLELCRLTSTSTCAFPFYTILGENHVRLKRLVADHVSEATMDYLQSYSGLECLSLKNFNDNDQNGSWANLFFDKCLPLHRDTLVDLEIHPKVESRWCFGEHNVDAFRRCRNLRSLSVRVECRGMPLEPISDTERLLFSDCDNDHSSPNPVHLLLNATSSSLPDLQTLHVDATGISKCIGACDDIYACSYLYEAEYFAGARRRIWASINHSGYDGAHCGAYDPTVLKWVKMYVGGRRVTVQDNRNTDAVDLGDEYSPASILCSIAKWYLS